MNESRLCYVGAKGSNRRRRIEHWTFPRQPRAPDFLSKFRTVDCNAPIRDSSSLFAPRYARRRHSRPARSTSVAMTPLLRRRAGRAPQRFAARQAMLRGDSFSSAARCSWSRRAWTRALRLPRPSPALLVGALPRFRATRIFLLTFCSRLRAAAAAISIPDRFSSRCGRRSPRHRVRYRNSR